MTLNLIADRKVNGKIYPALAQTQGCDFDRCWPYTVPLRLYEYCIQHSVPLNIYSINDFPTKSFYPIGLGFFKFSIDVLPVYCERVATR
jgi:hypothetical protein